MSQRIDLVGSSLPSSEQLVLEAVEETTPGVRLLFPDRAQVTVEEPGPIRPFEL